MKTIFIMIAIIIMYWVVIATVAIVRISRIRVENCIVIIKMRCMHYLIVAQVVECDCFHQQH